VSPATQDSTGSGSRSRPRSRSPEWSAIALIIAALLATSGLGNLATDSDSQWYMDLNRPEWQPASGVFGPVWTLLYILIATSMVITWHRTTGQLRRTLFTVWAANLVLNVLWTVIFFQGQAPVAAGIEIILLELTTIWLIFRTWPVSRMASLALVPYALWVGFATVLTWSIASMN
jgi:translocator protein